MADFEVRQYRCEDAEAVKEVFTLSMAEHVHATFLHVLRQPLAQALLAAIFCGLLVGCGSPILPSLACAALLAGARLLAGYAFSRYIRVCLQKDLGCIREAYVGRKDRCFWVAESRGLVVGTVACLPSEQHDGCLELKRMAVRRSHRGLGIAKALCRTVLDFARQRGHRAVVLYTSVVQTEAQRLYEGLGYNRVGEAVVPEVLAEILNFTLIEYRYELLERRDG